MGFGDRESDPYALRDPYETPAPGQTGQTGRIRGRAGKTSFAAVGAGPAGTGGMGYGAVQNAFGNKHLAISLAVALALVLAALLCAWNVVRGPNIGAYADEEISIVGLADEAFAVTPAELAELKCSQLTVEGQGKGQGGESKAGTVTAYGPTLARFVEEYGFEPTDFARIVITCSDGYKVTLLGDMLNQTVILSIAQGKSPLDEGHRPMRLVMPSAESGKWCYGIESMEFQRLADETVKDEAEGEGAEGDAALAGEMSGVGDADASASAEISSAGASASSESASAGSSSSSGLKSFGQS